MRVLLASPSVRPALSGNATTVDRWAHGLRARGHECSVVQVPASWGGCDFLRAVEGFEVIHLYHAARCGRFVDEARQRAAVVVSFAGTDLADRTDVVLRAG